MQVLIVTGGLNGENFGSPWGVNHTEVKYFYHFNALIITSCFFSNRWQSILVRKTPLNGER